MKKQKLQHDNQLSDKNLFTENSTVTLSLKSEEDDNFSQEYLKPENAQKI